MFLLFPFGFIIIFWGIIPVYFPLLLKKIIREPSITGFGRKLDATAGSLEREAMAMRVRALAHNTIGRV
ncbi:MAG: hypothetical protein ACXAD7_27540 [Candidatus Kariarchaeaceae archaeon]